LGTIQKSPEFLITDSGLFYGVSCCQPLVTARKRFCLPRLYSQNFSFKIQDSLEINFAQNNTETHVICKEGKLTGVIEVVEELLA
jgi:hypothetical protein